MTRDDTHRDPTTNSLLSAYTEADLRRKAQQAKHSTTENKTPLTGDYGPLLTPPAGTAPPADLTPQPTQQANLFEQRQAAKKERFEELAAKAKAESDSAHQRARDMASVIPFGQPILVGHHSEGRDRRYRARISSTFDKSAELSQKADYYQRRADAVGQGGVSSDDPAAIDKLQAEIAKLEKWHERMKAANALIRKDDRAGLAAMGFPEISINKLFTPDFCGRIGFPDYALTNNGANIRRIQKRIEQLQAMPTESTEHRVDFTEGNVQALGLPAWVTIREDVDEGRIMLTFPGKPSEAVREILKRSAFKWSPTRAAWVRYLNPAGRAAAQYVVAKIAEAQ